MIAQDFRNYLKRYYETSARRMRFPCTTIENFVHWQGEAHNQLTRLLAIGDLSQVPLEMTVHVEEDAGAYRIQKISYQTLPGIRVPAYLLTPRQDGSKSPTLLAPHGHGYGKEQLMSEDGAYHQYVRRFAEAGFVVLVPDQISFGERTETPGCSFEHEVLNMLGGTLIGYRLWDLARALDLLETLPQVDDTRIGCAGLSLGGEMTLYLAAHDPRVKVACIASFLTSFAGTFLKEPHCTCGYIPGMARDFEHADIAALIAPRPLMIQAGTQDPSFLVEDARATYEELAELYQMLGHTDRVALDTFDGGHEFYVEPAIEWFEKWFAI